MPKPSVVPGPGIAEAPEEYPADAGANRHGGDIGNKAPGVHMPPQSIDPWQSVPCREVRGFPGSRLTAVP